MADTTRRFGFTVLDSPTDQLTTANYKFSEGDRYLLDQLLRVAVEDHTHTGASISISFPDATILRVSPTGGALPPNVTVYYRYSIVDNRGQETIASATASVHTPVPATAPGYGPRLSIAGGYMEPGEYLYACSASTFEPSQETLLGPITSGTLATFGGWRLDLPPLPTGGHFFNVYRRGPRETELKFLATLAPSDRVFIDNGDLHANQFRNAPRANTTYRTSSIEVKLPASLFSAGPLGAYSWKLFRTFDPANWENSLLDWNGQTDLYVDDGRATRVGYPPSTTSAVGGAPKIQFVKDTEGVLPPSAAIVTRVANFNVDPVVEGAGTWYWTSEYEAAELVSMSATVNPNTPPSTPLQIGIDRWNIDDWDPVMERPNSSTVAKVAIGEGETAGTTAVSHRLARKDRLRLHVWEADFGSEGPVRQLNLVVTMRVRASGQTYTWETT
jgi:hypothetical protein